MSMLFQKNISRHIHTNFPLLRETPKNLKGKKHSSQLWLTRQLKDPYVEKAKQENYRCRSAFKLLEINERFKILNTGNIVVDCGAAPGGWTQVAVNITNANDKKSGDKGTVVSIDRLPIHPIEGATILSNTDFTLPKSQETLLNLLKERKVDVVLSDMAPNATGVKEMDHDNIIKLAYSAFKFAITVTKINGIFVTKIWDGGKTVQLMSDLSKFYNSVKCVRPQATRTESSEIFILARNFKGIKSNV